MSDDKHKNSRMGCLIVIVFLVIMWGIGSIFQSKYEGIYRLMGENYTSVKFKSKYHEYQGYKDGYKQICDCEWKESNGGVIVYNCNDDGYGDDCYIEGFWKEAELTN